MQLLRTFSLMYSVGFEPLYIPTIVGVWDFWQGTLGRRLETMSDKPYTSLFGI